MKWIIILLLLINGGYFSWQYYYVPGLNESGEDIEAQDKTHDTLVLLSDLSDERKEMLGIVQGSTDTVPDSDNSKEKEIVKSEPDNVDIKSTAAIDQQEKVSGVSSVPDPASSDDVDKEKSSMSKEPENNSTGKSVVADSKFCYVIGPIKKKSSIERLSRHIGSMGLDIIKVRKTVDKVPSHWIYLSGYKSENDANHAISKLASKSIKDTQLIKRSASNILISVGLFSTKAGADERLKQLQDAGFAPQTSMVTANKSLYWMDLKYKDFEMINDSILNGMAKGISGAKVQQNSCEKR